MNCGTHMILEEVKCFKKLSHTIIYLEAFFPVLRSESYISGFLCFKNTMIEVEAIISTRIIINATAKAANSEESEEAEAEFGIT